MGRLLFCGYQLDPAQRELRHQGELVATQPQVFDLVAYLAEHRDRVIGKQELLAAVWRDAAVTEGSLQRTMSLARAALSRAGAEVIRTFPRRGYRFVADVVEGGDLRAQVAAPTLLIEKEPSHAESGDVRIAYCVLGQPAPIDLLVIAGWSFPMSSWFALDRARNLCADLARLGRLILFDKRGIGQSDPVKRAPSLAERMEDACAVLDAAGSARAVVIGISEGTPLALLLAATCPARVAGLALVGGFARMAAAPDYPCGWSPERIDTLRRYIRGAWGAGATIRAMVPRHAQDLQLARWATAAEQRGSSPAAALDLLEMNISIDVRPLVAAVQVPSVVLHQRDDAVIPAGCGRYLAEHLPRCRHVEIEGDDHVFLYDGTDVLVREVGELVARARAEAEETRFFATALAARFEGHPRGLEEVLARFAASAVAIGRGRLTACFDGPARALRCAAALCDLPGARAACAVHASEVARDGDTVRGPAIELATAIAAQTQAGDIRVTRVVVDLLSGAEPDFAPDGEVGAVPIFLVLPPPGPLAS